MTNKKEENKIVEITELTEQEVWDVLKFAESLSGGIYPGVLTPMLVNQRMKDITMNPLQATETTLNTALASIKDSELVLQSFSQNFEIQSQVYKKLLSYLGNMLSFDLTYSCINADLKDYKSPKYQKDLAIVKDFFDRFDYRKEFSTAVKQMLRSEAFFCVPRFDGKKIVLQELPTSPQYTMITGRWDEGLSFSFNMYWFLLPGVDLAMYPRFFAEKYQEIFSGDSGMQKYNPALAPENRGGSAWVYWQDIPASVGWCFKYSPEISARVPYFTGLFLDLIQQPTMRALQKNINMTTAARLIAGQVGLLKDAGAKVKDQFTINPDTLGKFLALVKSAIGDSIKVAAAPLENIQAIAFPAENGVYNSYLKTALATSGVNTNLIFTSDVRPNAIESQLSLNVDEQQMYALYPQFESFLNYNVNKLTKNFKFKFSFEGTQFFNNRKERFETQMTLASNGIVLPHKIASAIGMNPFDFQRQMEESKANGWVDSLTPIVSGFQAQAGEKQNGRPQKSDSELGDSGAETRSSGANVDKGGKI